MAKYPEELPVFRFEGILDAWGTDTTVSDGDYELRPGCFDDGWTVYVLSMSNGIWVHPKRELAFATPLTRAARELLAWSRQ
jgi:hypothetical protein